MLVIPMKTHRDEVDRRAAADQPQARSPTCGCSPRDVVEREVVPFDAALRRAGDGARVAGGGRDRERPAVRGHRAAVRGLRHRRGHGDRIARSDDVRSLGARRDAHRRAGRGGGPRRRRAVPRRRASRASSCASCATPACCTTSARSACASRCWSRRRSSIRRTSSSSATASPTSIQRAELEFERARAELSARARARRLRGRACAALERERRARRDELAPLPRRDRPGERADGPRRGQLRALADDRASARSSTSTAATRPLLEDHELQFLMIRKGNLDDAGAPRDRVARHAHVSLPRADPVDARAARHPADRLRASREAERPRLSARVTGDEIPVQTRMMTIADIYDALTATDRPYKRAVPRERALDILAHGSEGGHARRRRCSRRSSTRACSRRCSGDRGTEAEPAKSSTSCAHAGSLQHAHPPPRRLDRQHVAGLQLHATLGRKRRAVQQIAPHRAARAARRPAGARRRRSVSSVTVHGSSAR